MGASAVDLNLGCPARRVVRHDGGAALLKHPERVARLVGAMRRAVSIPLTVKFRAGWDDTGPNAVELARIIEGEGADAVALHARTGRQQFAGTADWRSIAAVKQAISIPVIGNGDVRLGMDAWRMRRETACDAVMIGRGAIGNPWLWREALAWLAAGGPPREAPVAPSHQTRLDTLLEHCRTMARHKGEPKGVIEFRKHAVQYAKGMPAGKSLKQAIMECRRLADVEQAVETYRSQPEFEATLGSESNF
jgi:nifR3 family TIM-barrel protein